MKTVDEIKKEVAKECGEKHFDVIFEAEINAKFFDREKIKIDTAELMEAEELLQLCAVFVGMIILEGSPKRETKKEPKKSKFQERLEQMAKEKGYKMPTA